MNPEPQPDLQPGRRGRRAPYSAGEMMTIWLCLLTPGIAIALLLVAYVDWVGTRMSSRHFGGELLVYGLIVATFVGCAAFAGYIHAQKSGREKLVPRSIKLALQFLLIQFAVSPFVIVIIAKLVLRV